MPGAITPVQHNARLEIFDIIRGFAILGILIANIQSWSGYKYLPFDDLADLPYAEYEHALHHLFRFFIDSKFYTLFSLLFGIGFYLQFHRYKDEQGPFIRAYRRRLGVLLLFGTIHGLIWSGDILFLYAAVGSVFILFRDLSTSRLFILALLFYYGWLLYDIIVMAIFPEQLHYTRHAYKHYPDMTPEALAEVMRDGTILEVWRQNLHNLMWRYYDFLPSGRIAKVLAIFLLGYWLMRIDYFRRYATSIRLFVLYLIIGTGLTYAALALGGSMTRWSHTPSNIAYKAIMSSGQIALAMAYVNALSILYSRSILRPLLTLFAPVGRMSFTDYLMQTLFGILIFYSFAGGFWGSMGLYQITLLALTIYAFQTILSIVWLKYFLFGPLEWAWRCLTYKRLFPIRKSIE